MTDRKKKTPSHIREIEEGLYSLAHKAADMLQLISEGFNLHSKKHLLEAEKLAKAVHDADKKYTTALVEELKKHKDELNQVKELIPVPGHIERIGDYCESIIVVTKSKIKDGVLFSDRAASEVNHLFKGLNELIKSAGDIVLTKNALLTRHLLNETKKLDEYANDCATLHEERLVLGICNPKGSSLFLDILDSIRGIAYHLGKIAETTLAMHS